MVKPLVPPMVDILGPYASTPQHALVRAGKIGDAAGSGFTWLKDCTDDNAEDGTPLTAAFFNNIKAQLLTLFQESGSSIDDTDVMLALAIQSGGLNWAIATGSANAWIIATALPVPAYKAGRVLWVRAPATNTSTVVNANVSGLGNRLVKKADGTDPAIGDLVGARFFPVFDDGTSLRVISALASDYSQPMNQKFITASESFIVPASTLWIEGVGGGGPGGASGDGSGGGIVGNMGAGGGAGGFFRKIISGLTIGSTIAATIGAGGAPVSGGVGGNGGTTSFGAHASATGGEAGNWGANTAQPGGNGGMGSGGDLNLAGAPGGRTGPNSMTPTASDILTIYGRGGVSFGGLSILNLVSTGSPGLGFGSGGNGASGGSGVAGGAGAPGYIWVRW